ncbi:hypothetical protein RFI_23978 [Reticulomyxa filosa]|uniref:RGS domain-containing protein n=1 Tax=Reticulomyxa filosa TaxID=46433 RepID=X6MJ13_RETFI|nr:hypothetical protein RFI_23978 [Reticulomyxa filosa]|eukprot:ETO13397.1 hypothetical protein RFI_23978 [Reticulomyxa filosa]
MALTLCWCFFAVIHKKIKNKINKTKQLSKYYAYIFQIKIKTKQSINTKRGTFQKCSSLIKRCFILHLVWVWPAPLVLIFFFTLLLYGCKNKCTFTVQNKTVIGCGVFYVWLFVDNNLLFNHNFLVTAYIIASPFWIAMIRFYFVWYDSRLNQDQIKFHWKQQLFLGNDIMRLLQTNDDLQVLSSPVSETSISVASANGSDNDITSKECKAIIPEKSETDLELKHPLPYTIKYRHVIGDARWIIAFWLLFCVGTCFLGMTQLWEGKEGLFYFLVLSTTLAYGIPVVLLSLLLLKMLELHDSLDIMRLDAIYLCVVYVYRVFVSPYALHGIKLAVIIHTHTHTHTHTHKISYSGNEKNFICCITSTGVSFDSNAFLFKRGLRFGSTLVVVYLNWDDEIISLENILAQPKTFDMFASHLASELSLENLFFLTELMQLKYFLRWQQLQIFSIFYVYLFMPEEEINEKSLGWILQLPQKVIEDNLDSHLIKKGTICKQKVYKVAFLMFHYLYQRYVQTNSLSQINIASEVRQPILDAFAEKQIFVSNNSDLTDAKHTICRFIQVMDIAAINIYRLLENDSLVRFLKSERYQQYISLKGS